MEVTPEEALVCFHAAWNYDLLGEESRAVVLYEKALQLGLPDAEQEKTLLQLGSTYRTLGIMIKQRTYLRKGSICILIIMLSRFSMRCVFIIWKNTINQYQYY
ncbi:tetratricopeptide repeat protein [Lentibacillus sp. JNUCC-1]|uniref:tetratricopeptide repeat protein n=1 Tax=Lentibacillus sp. JNUCC-1 TaxID=2654513 RepID=UPI001E4613A2|nr:tetratricopeptide repeat protein [Lentibacillus sp. JNUCC-1]